MLQNSFGSELGGEYASKSKSQKIKNRRPLNNISNSLIDSKDISGTVSGTSCTSGFTTRALEIQQKLKWKKKSYSSRRKKKSTNDDLREISEEYDIQTIVSGLTRNSEFPEQRDPPVSLLENDDALEKSGDWPDDETSGGFHHVIHIMDGDKVTTKDTIRSRVDDHHSRKHEDLICPGHEEITKAPVSTRKIVGSYQDTKSDPPTRKNREKIYQTDSGSGYEVLIAAEPDGVTLKNGRPKIPIEPSGKKIENLFFGCSTKIVSPRKNSYKEVHTRKPTVMINNQDVELVYREIGSERRSSRKRSKSINNQRRIGSIRKSPNNVRETYSNRKSKEAYNFSVDEKRRSRSLPRTLKRITSGYDTVEGLKKGRDPSPTKKELTSPFINGFVGIVENDIVSPLGSQCEGIESQTHKHQTEKVPTKKVHGAIVSPIACKGMLSPLSCDAMNENTEPRVCIEFSDKSTGGYFHTTCFSDEKSGDAGNISQIPDKVSNLTYPENNMISRDFVSQKYFRKLNTDKVQLDESSRNPRLSPILNEDSSVENATIFEKCRQAASSHSKSLKGNGQLDAINSKCYSTPITPTSEEEVRQTYSNHSSDEIMNDPHLTILSSTSSGRKDLIQRYLSLRERTEKPNASICRQGHQEQHGFSSGCSIGSDSSKRQGSLLKQKGGKSGYDDASVHYLHVDTECSPSDSSSTGDVLQTNIRSRGINVNVQARRSSNAMTSIRKSASESDSINARKMSPSFDENLFSMPNAYKPQKINEEQWKSPTLVSSFPVYQQPVYQQEKLSYSYASDDTSSASSFVPKSMFDVYNTPSNYEEQLLPHHQFMKMQIGVGNR